MKKKQHNEPAAEVENTGLDNQSDTKSNQAEPETQKTKGAQVTVSADGVAAKKVRSFSLERRRAAAGYIFSLPFIIGFLAFLLFPLVQNLILSLGNITEIQGLKTEFTAWSITGSFSWRVLSCPRFPRDVAIHFSVDPLYSGFRPVHCYSA